MKLTKAEWQIMNVLWKDWPATARQIADRLPDEVNWAYTTIKTMLTRLADKQAVRESKKGHVGVYEPNLTRRDARRNALDSLLDQAFDGAFGPLMHFLVEDEKLSPKERHQVMEILKKRRNQRKGAKR